MSRAQDDEDDGFTRYTGPQKRQEVSRKELLGVGGPRVPKAKARQQQAQQEHQAAQAAALEEQEPYGRVTRDAYRYDPGSDNPLRRAEQRELEQLAEKKSREVTSDLRSVLKVSEDTKVVGTQTLSTLKQQGEQISRIHEKSVQLEQEMAQGEKFLNKLGGMFSAPWKVKKGKKISGPKYEADSSGYSGNSGEAARAELFNSSGGAKGQQQKTKHGNYLDVVEDETAKQDDMLDQISSNLSQMKAMAEDMGKEMNKQDKALDSLAADTDELRYRQDQMNQRGRRILGRRG